MEKSFEPSPEEPRQERLMPAEAKVFDLLVIEHKKSAIKLRDFLSLYGPTVIEADQRYIDERRKKIEQSHTEPTKRSEIVEALISEQIELSDWFGPEAATIVPSEFDDLKNWI